MSDEDSEDDFLSADEGSEGEDSPTSKPKNADVFTRPDYLIKCQDLSKPCPSDSFSEMINRPSVLENEIEKIGRSRPTASFPQDLKTDTNLNDDIYRPNLNIDYDQTSCLKNLNESENKIVNADRGLNCIKLEEVPPTTGPIQAIEREESVIFSSKLEESDITLLCLPKDNVNDLNLAEDQTIGLARNFSIIAPKNGITDSPKPRPIEEIQNGEVPEYSSINKSDQAKQYINNDETIVYTKKAIKESKIGLKKPREKLGERLGNKKLGSRVTKPLVGISYDSLQIKSEEIQDSLVDKQCEGSSTSFKNQNLCNFSNEENTTCPNTEISECPEASNSSTNWGSWGDWGSTLVSAASTLTKEVSRGVGSVIESVETGLGVPDPEVLARETVEIEKQINEGSVEDFQNEYELHKDDESGIPSGNLVNQDKVSYSFGLGGLGALGSIVSGVSGAFETASNTVLIGGLETLEKIGRKTMDVIQDGDPGLRRKRAFLHSKKPNLSTILKEARERAIDEEELNAELGDNSLCNTSSKTVSMALIWDGTEGSAHLEALGLVAKQCQRRTTNIMHELPALGLNRLHPILAKIKACNEIEEGKVFENISKDLNKITRDVQLPLQFGKLMTGWPMLEDSIKKLSIQVQAFGNDEKVLIDIQRDLFEDVAATVSHMIGLTHKAAELSLITPDLNYVNLAQQFRELCSCISFGLEASSDQICESVTRSLPSSDPFVSSSVTNIYVQMAEANSYIQTALQHLITVLVQAQAKQVASEL